MAQNLPEGSLFGATLSAQREIAQQEMKKSLSPQEYRDAMAEMNKMPELERLIGEKRVWSMTNTLLAIQLNRSRGSEKDPVVGPEVLWPESQKRKAEVQRGPRKSRLQEVFGGLGGE